MSPLTPKHHLILQSNIRTLILHNPNIKTLRIPADLLALHPKLLFDILEHHLPYLEQLELGPLTSKSYTYSPSSAQDCADLGLENDSSDSGNRDGNRDNVVKAAYFSGTIDWEITVQLLETCLWKRPAITNNNNNKTNTHLLKLRCLYHIPDNATTTTAIKSKNPD
ncbi:hypothetical protein BGZ97_001045 [Linnemannia gamsii]|uniref:Uncharacterized protein n=1 Tax=Linnemannia gamsii TaxID=64522 RepID=A0A9P6R1X6_9FUNG|nr:hypothetical protein BGZ97_001045 [Linnemannia gamsii]